MQDFLTELDTAQISCSSQEWSRASICRTTVLLPLASVTVRSNNNNRNDDYKTRPTKWLNRIAPPPRLKLFTLLINDVEEESATLWVLSRLGRGLHSFVLRFRPDWPPLRFQRNFWTNIWSKCPNLSWIAFENINWTPLVKHDFLEAASKFPQQVAALHGFRMQQRVHQHQQLLDEWNETHYQRLFEIVQKEEVQWKLFHCETSQLDSTLWNALWKTVPHLERLGMRFETSSLTASQFSFPLLKHPTPLTSLSVMKSPGGGNGFEFPTQPDWFSWIERNCKTLQHIFLSPQGGVRSSDIEYALTRCQALQIFSVPDIKRPASTLRLLETMALSPSRAHLCHVDCGNTWNEVCLVDPSLLEHLGREMTNLDRFPCGFAIREKRALRVLANPLYFRNLQNLSVRIDPSLLDTENIETWFVVLGQVLQTLGGRLNKLQLAFSGRAILWPLGQILHKVRFPRLGRLAILVKPGDGCCLSSNATYPLWPSLAEALTTPLQCSVKLTGIDQNEPTCRLTPESLQGWKRRCLAFDTDAPFFLGGR